MIEQHHLNEKVKLFTGAILSTAKETMPRGRTRDYIPDWNAQLQELHSTASRLREKMESCPRDDNIAAYNKAKAEFTKQKLQQTHALCVCVCVCVCACVWVCPYISLLSALQALMSGEPDTMQKKLTENISTLAQTTCVILQWIPAHTGIRGNEIADQLAKKEGERSKPHHTCPTEKSKLLSVTRRKPLSTARLADTTKTRTHSISCYNTNRPSSFTSEQATADWIAI